MAATRRPRVSFGLADRSRDGVGPQGTDLPEVALTRASLNIEDGVLMAFGPEGDPIPPAAFAAAAAGQPDIEIVCGGHGSVRASKVVAVLEAQARGPLSSAHGDRVGGERWILAMLGLGPQPEVASEAELGGERRGCELTAFGRELMITMPSGRSFLIAEASPAHRTEAAAGLSLDDGQAVSVGDLVARLRGRHQQDRSPAGRAGAELGLPDCAVQSAGDALLLQLPSIGVVRLALLGSADGAGPRVSIFRANGEPAGIAEVIAELGHARSAVAHPAGSGLPGKGSSSPPPARPALDGGAVDWKAAAAPAIAATVLLPVGLPGGAGLDAERVVVVVIAGVPQGALLSAGIDNGDGSWTLSPQDLAGLTLRPPTGYSEDLALKVTALTVENFEGELAGASETIRVSFDPGAPIALAIDPAVLQADGPGLNALVLRDLPEGATLSAGTYEPAIDGWVLLPRQLPGLTLTAPAGHAAFTLTVMGVSLGAGGGGEAKVLARLPIAPR
jgi:hypothetical protein